MVAAPIIEQPDPQREVLPVAIPGYLGVAAARLVADQALWRLPTAVDDLQREFGYDIYARIALDPQVKAGERVLMTAALNQGVQYIVPVPRQDPHYAAAARYQKFVDLAFQRLPVPLESLLYEMGTAALTHGHKLSEVVWTTAKVLPNYGPQLLYADIKPKPLHTYAFVQDQFANTAGITPVVPGLARSGVIIGGMLAGQPVYALDKFPVLTWDGTNRDPRGNSLLRTIYGPWWKKQQAEPGLLAYLARFAQPSVDIEMPPNAPDQVTLPDGSVVQTKDLYLALGQAMQAGGVSVRPAGSSLDLKEATSDGAAYINAEKLWNQAIWMGLTGQTLATGEGQHRSGSDSRTHQDMLGLLVTFIKFWLSDFVNRRLIAPLLVANYGAAALPLAPRVDLGRISPEDLTAMAQAIGQLTGMGYWDPTKMPPDVGAELDTRIGFPQRQIVAVGPTGTPTDQAQPPQAGQAPADPPADTPPQGDAT